MKLIPASLALIACFAAGPGTAQTTSLTPDTGGSRQSIGTTRSGDLPSTTGSTTAVGKTKPEGAPVGDQLGTRPDLEEKSRDLDRKIRTGICSGCN